MQYLKTSLMGPATAAISGMGNKSQSSYHAWDILCEKCGRSDVIVNAQLKKKHNHPPVWHDNSTSIVKFANVGTNVVNTSIQLGYKSDLESRIRSRAEFSNDKNFLPKRGNSGCSMCKIVNY